MLKKLIIIGLGLLALNAKANVLPTKIYFKENEKISLALSPASYNKILINNEKITDFYFVNGDFIVADTNELDEFVAKDDGSIYVVPQTDRKPVIYLTTNKGHHLAIEVSLNDKSGQIISLEYGKVAPVATAAKKKTRAPSKAEILLKELVANKLTNVQGTNVESQTKEQRINDIGLQLIKSYQKDNFKAYVYRAKNLSQKTITINPKQFFEKNTKALSLEERVLAPNQSTYVYSVIGEGNHA